MTQAQNSKRLFWKFENLDLEFVPDFGFFNYIGSYIVHTVLIQLR